MRLVSVMISIHSIPCDLTSRSRSHLYLCLRILYVLCTMYLALLLLSTFSFFLFSFLFFFNDPATTEIYTLSLHDALPIWRRASRLASSMEPTVVVTTQILQGPFMSSMADSFATMPPLFQRSFP